MTRREQPRQTPPPQPRSTGREWTVQERPSGYEGNPRLVVIASAGDASVM